MGEGIWVFFILVGFGLSENELQIEENVPPTVCRNVNRKIILKKG